MNQESVAALMRAAAPVIAGFVAQEVSKATAPLIARIEELETRPPEKGDKGEPGASGKDGESVSLDAVSQMIDRHLELAIAEIELPKGDKGEPGERGEKGDAGIGVTVDDVAPLIADGITKAIAEIELPKGEKGEPGANAPPPSDEQVATAVIEYLKENPPPAGENGAPGKDGAGLADCLIDREGNLVLTLTDGEVRHLGVILGKDGAPGKDGRDGFSPEDLQVELKEDGRTLVVKLVRGENIITREVVFPVVLDRGVWKEGHFQKGDGVTWGGSFFIAQCDTEAKPETSSDWRLAVKRGRDGKDGKPGERGEKGSPGKDMGRG